MLYCSPSQQNGDQSSRLLVIDRREINTAFEYHIFKFGVIQDTWEFDLASGFWIAGNDSEVEGEWRWSDTYKSVIPTRPDQSGFQKWYRKAGRNEPSNAVGNEDCLYISNIAYYEAFPHVLGSWFSSDCSSKKYFVCQANKSSKFKSSLSLKISYESLD